MLATLLPRLARLQGGPFLQTARQEAARSPASADMGTPWLSQVWLTRRNHTGNRTSLQSSEQLWDKEVLEDASTSRLCSDGVSTQGLVAGGAWELCGG